ncbi:MAG: hypothetical protein D3909_01890 [Candidatus Electrothrix sp. ATG1]|nr:hypothetical protein [Candidatus Electrothrix sp. ATG1]
MKTVICPACGGKIKIYYDHELGDEVYCEECKKEFQLMCLKPIRLESFDTYDDDYYFYDDDLYY